MTFLPPTASGGWRSIFFEIIFQYFFPRSGERFRNIEKVVYPSFRSFQLIKSGKESGGTMSFLCHKLWYCKSYLLCSKRSENIINRKIGNFYIEAILQKNSQLRKKTYFFRVPKKKWKIFSEKKKSENLKKIKNFRFRF